MGFLITCDNKGCFESMEPLLDKNTDRVFCTACGKEMKSVTYFAKVQMKSMGQTLNSQKTSQAFSVRCNFCGSVGQPIVAADGKILCSACKSHMDYLSAPFAHTIRQMVSKGGNNQ